MGSWAKLGLNGVGRCLDGGRFVLAGGCNQRVGMAMAMLLNPCVLVADERTSALDGVMGRQAVLELLALREHFGTAILLVTHDMGTAAAMADRILVLKDGTAAEYGPAGQVLAAPKSRYTRELLEAVPSLK